MDRLEVPLAQFGTGDFPAVCAVTGERAEKLRKFSFPTAPLWGLLLTGRLGADLFWPHVTGYLPVSNRGDWRMTYGLWIWFGFVPVGFVFFLPSAFSATDWSAAKTGLFLLGVGSFLTGLVGILSERRRRPMGSLRAGQDRILIRHVHPSFVAAVPRHQPAFGSQIPLPVESK